MSDWQPWLFLHSLLGIWRKWDLPYQTKFGGVTKFGVTPKYFGNIVYDVFICIYTDRCIHVYSRCSSQCWVQKLCWSCCLKFSSHHNSPASFFNDISRFDLTWFVFSTSCFNSGALAREVWDRGCPKNKHPWVMCTYSGESLHWHLI